MKKFLIIFSLLIFSNLPCYAGEIYIENIPPSQIQGNFSYFSNALENTDKLYSDSIAAIANLTLSTPKMYNILNLKDYIENNDKKGELSDDLKSVKYQKGSATQP